MKIAFLSPAGAMHRYNGSFGKGLHYAPLTMTTLASLVPEEMEAEMKIYDETVEAIPLDLDADIVLITAITGTSTRAYRFADYFRSRGITVFLGGVQPTLDPAEAGKHCDALFTGVADYTFPQALKDYKAGKLQPVYRETCEISLAGRPIPRRDLLKPRAYITTNSVEAVRGCPLPCTFCAYPAAFGKTPVCRSVNDVIAEIEQLKGKYVLFPDVNLLADMDYAKQLFTAMIPLKKRWFGLTTSSVDFDKAFYKTLEKSGCKGILIGFESVNQAAQGYIKKGVNKTDDYETLVKRLHDSGILINGCFAFGGDDDGKDVFKRTVEEVQRLRIDLPRYSILTPFPNTELYRSLQEQGRIFEHEPAMYDVEHVVFQPKNMTADELYEGTEWAWRETYKTSNILKRINKLSALSYITNFAYQKYADKFIHFTKEVMCDNSDIPEVTP
ncbi:MAG: radical SAM protein [Oscillospiraceae bacterium]|nr:radical SAM protein [Oscillospiraceae bacterium]